MSDKKRILVIEADKNLRYTIAQILKIEGYEVELAEDGEQGFNMVKDFMPNLIIADALAPKLDGSQLVKKVCETFFGKDIFFIILSARENMRDYFETLGVDGFLEKPIAKEGLLSEVKMVLNQSVSSMQKGAYKRVLIVGRDEECIEKMRLELKEEGCHTDFVLFGEQVISKAVLFLPNLIIMESRLRDTSTNSIIKILRQMRQFRKVPILIYNFFHDSELKNSDVSQQELTLSFFVRTCLDDGATADVGRYGDENFIGRVNKYIKKGNIVIIDDDEGTARILKKWLEREGYQVFAAREANVGLDLIKSSHPSLVILDVVMPGMSGYDLLGVLKSDVQIKDVPVMMLTVKGEDKEIQKGMDLGADDYIVKPFNMTLFMKRVQSVIKEA